jgi:hypothetical protein
MSFTNKHTITLAGEVQEILSGLSRLMGLKKSSLISFLILEKAREVGVLMNHQVDSPREE